MPRSNATPHSAYLSLSFPFKLLGVDRPQCARGRSVGAFESIGKIAQIDKTDHAGRFLYRAVRRAQQQTHPFESKQ